jgi:hypothetical protein
MRLINWYEELVDCLRHKLLVADAGELELRCSFQFHQPDIANRF